MSLLPFGFQLVAPAACCHHRGGTSLVGLPVELIELRKVADFREGLDRSRPSTRLQVTQAITLKHPLRLLDAMGPGSTGAAHRDGGFGYVHVADELATDRSIAAAHPAGFVGACRPFGGRLTHVPARGKAADAAHAIRAREADPSISPAQCRPPGVGSNRSSGTPASSGRDFPPDRVRVTHHTPWEGNPGRCRRHCRTGLHYTGRRNSRRHSHSTGW